MKLYEWNFAPNCRRVRMYLFEKGIEVERVECITSDIILKEDFRDQYVHEMVPMLELNDGTQIGEGLAIWHYFEALYPEQPLMGTTALEKATISSWERRAYDGGMIAHAEILRNSHPAMIDRGLPGYSQRIPQISALVDRGKIRVASFYKKFNDQLADNKFVAGESFSVADITTICVIDMGHAMEMNIPKSAYHVNRWYHQLQERESVQKSKATHMPDGSTIT
jgi:glutathione S-transferase